MKLWQKTLGVFRALLRKKKFDREMDEEMRLHLEMRTHANIKSGMSPEDARYAAMRSFGGMEQVKEVCRDIRGITWIETVARDAQLACRRLRRNPGFTAVTVLTLALGIGTTTAIFSMVNGVLLQPLPYPESDQLVYVQECIPTLADRLPVLPVSARHFIEWRQQCSAFENLSLIEHSSMNLTGQGEPERLKGTRVSANLFETLGIQPQLGRTFAREEESEGSHRVVLLSDRLWRQKFDANPSILGTTIILNQEAYIVIAILPASFRLPLPNPYNTPDLAINAQPDVFVPKVITVEEREKIMDGFSYPVMARLKKGTTPEAATAELNVIGSQLVKMAGVQFELRAKVTPLKNLLVQNAKRGLLLLLNAIGLVLLIACLNLAILNLVRSEAHSFDSAVRLALGAQRWRLLRQSLLETLLLTVMGATLGLGLASGGMGMLVRMAPRDLPRLEQVHIDAVVLLFAVALTGVTTLVSGLLPAWRAARTDAEQLLRTGKRTATTGAGVVRGGNLLIVAEVSLGVVLLIIAGLLLRSFVRVMHADKGFDAPEVLAVDVNPAEGKYHTGGRIYDFHARLLAKVRTMPGVRSAATVNRLPLRGQTWVSPVWAKGDLRPLLERPTPNVRIISPEYFPTLGIPLVAGRAFEERDKPQKVAVISQRLAETLWPGQEAVVGRQVVLANEQECQVIGVVKDVVARADEKVVPIIYHPYWWWEGTWAQATLVVRAEGALSAITSSIREALRNVDPELPIARIYTLREVLEASVSPRRFQMLLTSIFAMGALLLVALGVYGIVSCSVTRRTREMGIRFAFGARPLSVYSLVLRQGLRPVGCGLIVGMVGTYSMTQFLRSLLYEISPFDPLTILCVVIVLSVVVMAACCLPAWRASRIDPAVVLRYE